MADASCVDYGLCPICMKPLFHSLMKYLIRSGSRRVFGRRRTREERVKERILRRFARKEIKERTDLDLVLILSLCAIPKHCRIVATTCGHVFHSMCLQKYAYNFRLVTNSGFVACPYCNEQIRITSSIPLDLRPSTLDVPDLRDATIEQAVRIDRDCHRANELIREWMMSLAQHTRFCLTFMHTFRSLQREAYNSFRSQLQTLRKWRITMDKYEDELKSSCNRQVHLNVSLAHQFLEDLETDDSLPPRTRRRLFRIRTHPPTFESFRRFVLSLRLRFLHPATQTLQITEFREALLSILLRKRDRLRR